MPSEKGQEDRAIGVNISMPQSLFNAIKEVKGSVDRSVWVREAIYKYLESLGYRFDEKGNLIKPQQ